jgi:peptidyl-tRNA hydrolase, PTH1 family
MADDRWIIVGLGNPGPEYAGTRHNVGQMVLAVLAERMGARFKANRTRNDIAEGRLAGQVVTLARPHSYMNLSGGPVSALLGFYKLSPERAVVLHDELDVPFGGVRLKLGGGDNGHNGLRSISASLGTRDYYRVRFGIGRPPGRMDAANFVLRDFSAAERKELPFALDRCADAVETLITKGLTEAQNLYHVDPPALSARSERLEYVRSTPRDRHRQAASGAGLRRAHRRHE